MKAYLLAILMVGSVYADFSITNYYPIPVEVIPPTVTNQRSRFNVEYHRIFAPDGWVETLGNVWTEDENHNFFRVQTTTSAETVKYELMCSADLDGWESICTNTTVNWNFPVSGTGIKINQVADTVCTQPPYYMQKLAIYNRYNHPLDEPGTWNYLYNYEFDSHGVGRHVQEYVIVPDIPEIPRNLRTIYTKSYTEGYSNKDIYYNTDADSTWVHWFTDDRAWFYDHLDIFQEVTVPAVETILNTVTNEVY